MLKINSLNMSLNKKEILKDINYTFENGIYGLLGPNGAGKTTLIRSIAGLYPIKSGRILYDDVDIKRSKTYLSNLGYLPQGFGIFKELKPMEALMLLANIKGINKKEAKEEAQRVLEIVNLEDSKDKKIGAFSGGMLRRLGVAQALLGNPDVIIFDEPTAGLDPEERLRFKKIIATQPKDKTIIISTHIVQDLEAICNKVLVMNKGRIIKSGTRDDIIACANNKVYAIPCENQNNYGDDFFIQKYYEENGKQMMRVISNQNLEYKKLDACVEDGYICLIKEI